MVRPLTSPNGVGLSPDGDALYVADTLEGRVYRWALDGPGSIAGWFGPSHRGELLADPPGGSMFDSLAVDAAGNVCVATIRNGGITVISPDGAVDHVAMPDPLTTNICFGGPDGDTAFITLSGTGRLVSIPWPRSGAALAHVI